MPQPWDGKTAVPVVMAFHGAGQSAAIAQLSDGLNAKGDAEGFLVVHPDGLEVALSEAVHDITGWDVLGNSIDEPAFVSALLDDLGQQVCIDPSRVYTTGLSNGADMALAAACALPDRVAAVAQVSAGNIPMPCASKQPTPIVAFHGLDDAVVPYDGVPSGRDPVPEEQAMSDQATRNGCTGGPDVQSVTPTVDVLTWTGCQAPTVLYRLQDHGHAWPGVPLPFTRDQVIAAFTPPNSVMIERGLSPEAMADNVMLTNTSVNATDIMWDFFRSTA